MLYRRDTHVVELQMGPSQPRLEDACAPEHFDVARLPFVTLLGKHNESLFLLSHDYNDDHDVDDDDNVVLMIMMMNYLLINFLLFCTKTIASNPESSECPLNGAYSLLGPLGPPYLMSRHKRNHITNKHHHNATPFKKHDSLSFRNGETFEQTLHPHERFNNQRHRRDLSKCTGTHKMKRRLSIGCSKDSIVEVHPQCSENGDEGKQ